MIWRRKLLIFGESVEEVLALSGVMWGLLIPEFYAAQQKHEAGIASMYGTATERLTPTGFRRTH